MRNIILNVIAMFLLMSQLDTGEYVIGIAFIILFVNVLLDGKKRFE